MKINYGTYTYYDPSDGNEEEIKGSAETAKDTNTIFNSKKFNDLISNREYEAAYEYGSKFHRNNPQEDEEYFNYLENMRREGRIKTAVFSRINDKNTKDQIEFYDAVFKNKGLDAIPDNQYAKRFSEFKDNFGSKIEYVTDENGNKIKNVTKAESLAITFDKEKQPWYAPNNNNNFDNFLNTIGMTQLELEKAGINVINKDGKSTINFSKSNALANTILASIPNYIDNDRFAFTTNSPIVITGYDGEGNELDRNSNNVAAYEGLKSIAKVNDESNIMNLQSLISDAKDVYNNYFTKLNNDTRLYSSTISFDNSDNVRELKDKLAKGLISETIYKDRLKTANEHIQKALASFGTQEFEMFSNVWNETNTDNTLVKLTNEQRQDLAKYFRALKPEDLVIGTMLENNKIGAYIQIAPEALSKLESAQWDTDIVKKAKQGNSIGIFIPGLLHEEGQKALNRDTKTRAMQEINNMIDWEYDYKLDDGSVLEYNGRDSFHVNGEAISRQDAANLINKDLSIKEGRNRLRYHFINSNNKFTTPNGDIQGGYDLYEQQVKRLAIKTADEMYPNVPLMKFNGEKLSIDEIFAKKGIGESGELVFESMNEYNNELAEKLKEIYSIFDSVMKGANYHK